MSEFKIKQGAVVTIELPGLAAIRIDTVSRLLAIDGISGSPTRAEPCEPEWTVVDLRDGTYGGFHRLRPADECFDRDCAASGQHAVPAITASAPVVAAHTFTTACDGFHPIGEQCNLPAGAS